MNMHTLFGSVSTLDLMHRQGGRRPMIVDSFAGGGGASTGIEMALGRSPDIAINHNPAALALHAANHPETLHLSENVYRVDPLDHMRGRHIGLMHFSPDCKHFSKAKGGKPVERNIRDLAWIIPGWIERIQKSGGKVDVVTMENVEEWKDWGPLIETERGLMPCPDRRGHTFKAWCKAIKRLGGRIEWRELRACDYGAPTIRKRLFLVVRFDGKPIVWPEPTHGDPNSEDVIAGRKLPWRTAAEIIDWSLPCPSIFDTAPEIWAKHGLRSVRPLADNTMARVARGMKRYVLDSEKPFLVSIAHGDSGGRREYPLDEPFGVVTAGWISHAVVAPNLMTMRNSGKPFNGADEPISTVTATGAQQSPVMAFISRQFGTSTGHGAGAPLGTVTADGGGKSALVAPYLSAYYGVDQDTPMDEPVHTLTTKPRFGHVEALIDLPPFTSDQEDRAREVAAFLRSHGFWDEREFVTLEIAGMTFVIVDIGMRMLTPRELFNAQGFPPDYIIDGVWEGEGEDRRFAEFPKNVQVSCCGNSVSPPPYAAIVAANCPELMVMREAAE